MTTFAAIGAGFVLGVFVTLVLAALSVPEPVGLPEYPDHE